MFCSTEAGLQPLAPTDDILVDALDVFSGELTCCRLGHPDATPCDRERLMLPMLGLFAELYRDRHGASKEAYEVLEPLRDRLFPKTFEYTYISPDGLETRETLPLFGDLCQAVMHVVDAAQAGPHRRPQPDFAPGTTAQPRRRHSAVHQRHARHRVEASLDARRGESSPALEGRRNFPRRRSLAAGAPRRRIQ